MFSRDSYPAVKGTERKQTVHQLQGLGRCEHRRQRQPCRRGLATNAWMLDCVRYVGSMSASSSRARTSMAPGVIATASATCQQYFCARPNMPARLKTQHPARPSPPRPPLPYLEPVRVDAACHCEPRPRGQRTACDHAEAAAIDASAPRQVQGHDVRHRDAHSVCAVHRVQCLSEDESQTREPSARTPTLGVAATDPPPARPCSRCRPAHALAVQPPSLSLWTRPCSRC